MTKSIILTLIFRCKFKAPLQTNISNKTKMHFQVLLQKKVLLLPNSKGKNLNISIASDFRESFRSKLASKISNLRLASLS